MFVVGSPTEWSSHARCSPPNLRKRVISRRNIAPNVAKGHSHTSYPPRCTMHALVIAALYLGTALATFVLAVDVLDVVDPINRLIAH